MSRLPLAFKANWDLGWSSAVALYVGTVIRGNSTYGLAKPLEFESRPFGELLPGEPTLRMEEGQATQLMDALWSIGIRPTKAAVEPETTTAMKEHLADLRKLIFDRRVK